MRTRYLPLAFLAVCAVPAVCHAQFVADRYVVPDAERQELSTGRDRLRIAVEGLKARSGRGGSVRPDLVPDVEIYLDALDRNLRQSLFFTKASVTQALAILKEGESRAAALADGKTPWDQKTGFLTLGYRSRVDGSAQPYQVFVPATHDYKSTKPVRLDLFLHGRGGNLNELSFITSLGWPTSAWGTQPPPNLALYPYGRANNGWRFAGETDMWEALEDVQRRFHVDPDQTTLRGFSMGGHGAWHMGLQHPGSWAVMSPGAGFVDTINYQKITETLPEWQQKLLHLYDPIDYVTNAKNLPLLAYSGEIDPAIEQHRLILGALQKEGAPFKEYIGPQTPHRYEPAARTAILEEMAKQRRKPDAAQIDFVTYTLRWPECKWVRIQGLEHHWERAEVHAKETGSQVEVTTRNVTALRLSPPDATGSQLEMTVDGQKLGSLGPLRPRNLVRRGGKWSVDEPEGLRKKPGLQGPIDDALFGPMVAVSGTGTPWSEPLDRWTKLELQRFRLGWDEFFRATLPERTDRTLTTEDIRGKNLYLFGDPGSNAVLARLLPKLPLKWTKDTVEIAGKSFSTRDHLPMLVYPNPESPEHYVVIDCGFTFSKADWNGSNARQYPHLPDYAVIRFDPDHFIDERPKDTELAGFFDERWKVTKTR